MIKFLASSDNLMRAEALHYDVRVAVCCHDGGHALMGRLHGLRFHVVLPKVITKGKKTDIAEHAGAAIPASNLNRTAKIDLLFGGYCGELALYDEQHLRQIGAPFWVNASSAVNDMLGVINTLDKDLPNAWSVAQLLKSGGNKTDAAVTALFQKHGQRTYRTMCLHREELINIAQEMYDFWKAHNFKKCIWTQPLAG